MDSFQTYLLVVFLFAVPVIALTVLIRVEKGLLAALLMFLLPLAGDLVPPIATPANIGPIVFYPIVSTVVPAASVICLVAFRQLDAKRARLYPWIFAAGSIVTTWVLGFDALRWEAPMSWARNAILFVEPAISVWVGWLTFDALMRRSDERESSAAPFIIAVQATVWTSWGIWQIVAAGTNPVDTRLIASTFVSSIFGAFFYSVPLSTSGTSDDHVPMSAGRLAEIMSFTDGTDFGALTAPLTRILRRVRERATAPDVDPDTGLLAESELQGQLRSALDSARQNTGELTLIAASVDGLDVVERDLGPDIASTVLDSAAEAFMRATRSAQAAVRRDDQFVGIFPNMRLERLEEVPRELQSFSFGHPDLDDPVVLRPITARYPEDGTTAAELLSALKSDPGST